MGYELVWHVGICPLELTSKCVRATCVAVARALTRFLSLLKGGATLATTNLAHGSSPLLKVEQ